MTIAGMLLASALLDLTCWKHKKLSALFFYLECLWALYDVYLFTDQLRHGTLSAVFIGARLIAVLVLFSTDALPSIAVISVCAASAHALNYTVSGSVYFDAPGLVSMLLIVFVSATLFWAGQRQIAQKEAVLERIKSDRDLLLNISSLGETREILILSQADHREVLFVTNGCKRRILTCLGADGEIDADAGLPSVESITL